MLGFVAAAGGLIIGSFLNVVAYRLPAGQSLATPASRCPGCETPIRPYDNVPVLSWLLLRGQCRKCGERISARYPLVEALTAALFFSVVLVHGWTTEAALGVVLVALLVPIALIDLETQRIPNKLTYPGIVAAVVIGTALDPSGEPSRLLAAAIAGGIFFVMAFASRGMGMGDAKLVFMMGLFLGSPVGAAVMVALVVGTIVGTVVIARVGMQAGRKTKVPFGPFLALGGVVALLAGDPIVSWYAGLLG